MLACGIVATGFVAFQAERGEVRRSVEQQLDAIAKIKVEHLGHWWQERLNDARAFSDGSFLSREADAWLQRGAPDDAAGRALRANLAKLQETYNYRSIVVYDTAARFRLTAERHDTAPAHDRELVLRAMRERRTLNTDLHLEKLAGGEQLVLAIAAPLLVYDAGVARVVGALYLEIDPFGHLLNFVQFWPTPSASAETLIVRPEGNDILYLSGLRHRPNAVGRLRLPLSQQNLPAAMAVQGRVGVVEGVDYRGVAVFAALQRVPGTDWYLAAKIDQEEVYDSLNRMGVGIAVVVLLMTMASAAVVLQWSRRQRAAQEFAVSKAQLERAALARHYDYLSKYAHDIILLTDEHGNIIDANESAERAYGYPRAVLTTMNAKALRSDAARLKADEDWSHWSEAGVVYETEQRHKDGRTFPVEASARYIVVEGRKYLQAIVRDISERKHTAAMHDYLAALVESSTDAIIGVALDGTVASWNHGAELVYGYHSDEMIGRSIMTVVPAELQSATAQLINKVTAGERIARHETERLRKDGARIVVMLTLAPIHDDTNKVVGISGIASDVTQIKQAEHSLRVSERRFRALVETVNDVFWEIDAELHYTYISAQVKNVLGYEPAEVIGRTPFELMRPDEAQRVWQTFESIHRERRPFSLLENTEVRKDGSLVVLETNGIPIVDQQGRFRGYRGIDRDITARKRAEEALEASEVRLRGIIEHSSDGLLVLNRDGDALFINPAAEALLGIAEADMLGKHIGLVAGGADSAAIEVPRADGSVRYVDIRSTDFEWAGAPARIVTLHDSSAQRLLERERQLHTDRLQQTLIQTVTAIALTIEERDPYTAGHQQRVAQLAMAIGRELGLADDRVEGLYIGALIHDIGKIRIPAEILSRPGKLTANEFELIKTHPEVGYQIIKDIAFPWPVAEMVLQHHERLDGSGYPRGLAGDQIITEARIIAVADVIEAIISHRPYRPALSVDIALKEIGDKRGSLFDPAAVDACERLFREQRFRFQEAQLLSEVAFSSPGRREAG